MGTSSNQASPPTLNWRATTAAYRGDVPPARVAREVWRAATNDEHGSLPDLLMSPGVELIYRVAQEAQSASEGPRAASQEIAARRWSSLGTEIAKRALVQSFAYDDRAVGFVNSLLSEATAYLVARDLPGFVGDQGRAATVADAAAFKASVVESVRGRLIGDPHQFESWDQLIGSSIRRLKGVARAR